VEILNTFLPVGNNGSKPAQKGMGIVRDAQFSMNKVAEFKGNVKAFPSDNLGLQSEGTLPDREKQFQCMETGGFGSPIPLPRHHHLVRPYRSWHW